MSGSDSGKRDWLRKHIYGVRQRRESLIIIMCAGNRRCGQTVITWEWNMEIEKRWCLSRGSLEKISEEGN